jgi:serine/threonine protein kinase
MATVFLGRRVDGRAGEGLAAIKVILTELAKEAQFVAMFADEARLLSRLEHPNISRTLEVGHADHVGYIAMELLLGRTLADTWEAAKEAEVPFRFDVAAWICAQIARGLHHAHNLVDETGAPFQLVHRDVNPSNIFLTYDGSVKLFDFGLAKAQGRTALTKAGIVKGKVPYLSPEQLAQLPIDRRSDIFSLGATL